MERAGQCVPSFFLSVAHCDDRTCSAKWASIPEESRVSCRGGKAKKEDSHGDKFCHGHTALLQKMPTQCATPRKGQPPKPFHRRPQPPAVQVLALSPQGSWTLSSTPDSQAVPWCSRRVRAARPRAEPGEDELAAGPSLGLQETQSFPASEELI